MPHIECVKNNGKPYLRLAESRYVKDIGRQKKFVIKNLGPLSKFDDGKPDFLKRFREKFKNGEIDFDGITYYSNMPTKKTFEIDKGLFKNKSHFYGVMTKLHFSIPSSL